MSASSPTNGHAQTQPDTIRCPTCRAAQPWSDACRRCKCDLRLLRGVEQAWQKSRALCLAALRDGRARQARAHARECVRLRNDDDSQRLLSVCALAAGDWPAALGLAQGLSEAAALRLAGALRPRRMDSGGRTWGELSAGIGPIPVDADRQTTQREPVSYCDGTMIW